MPLHTVAPQRLYRQIAEQLRTLMVSGEFALGSRLPAERDLALQLGVSRPSVREALIALEVEGMIEVRTGSGIYVQRIQPLAKATAASEADANTPADWGPLEVMSARLLIEAEVAALAATHAKKTDIKAIKNGLQQMKLEAARDEVPREGDEAFHEAIAKACGNSVLLDTVQRYWQARNGPLFERLGDYFEHPASWQAAISEHQQVLQAIEAHDPTAARKSMQKHLKQAHKRYSASWRRAPAR
ncbi:FadR/GntR family transcriptional regulator [Limnohabitans sp.]|jgi:DNA-binding FadR family transcriptional regulator|uniref:FadR/GntR family transcriptional regulator n=1 Tax=Limnohabitans sp. TaxID=1907725 RepID=UPI001B6C35AF|nr:FadR/GntR family transcriptional regulator [Limnohabitans sp.]MBP6221242.1 FadR family transcriptional regulator [Limnohabitans sp.]MBP6245639.1 FadR family transcriptional regulator [Limnohabitans sp.]